MKVRDEESLEDSLFDNWFELRASGRLNSVLPPCASSGNYKTVDHELRRQVPIETSSPAGGTGFADLIEVYVSERTDGWRGPNLHINVVELKNVTMTVGDLEQLSRYVSAIRRSMARHCCYMGDIWTRGHSGSGDIYVHGALIGPSARASLISAASLLGFTGDACGSAGTLPMLSVGTFAVHPVSGFQIENVDEHGSRYPNWCVATHQDSAHAFRRITKDNDAVRRFVEQRIVQARKPAGGAA